MSLTLPALTLRQPWAWAMTHAGKRVENRTFAPPAKLVGASFALHAGKQLDWPALVDLAAAHGLRPSVLERACVRSAIVAVARLAAVVTESTDPWFVGPVGWLFTELVVLDNPVSCSGLQGVWHLDHETHAAVCDQLPTVVA